MGKPEPPEGALPLYWPGAEVPSSHAGGRCGCRWQERADSDLKSDAGRRKAQLQLVPPSMVVETSDAMAEGAAKYGPYSWRRKRVEMAQYLGAILRHTLALLDGEDVDPESPVGKTHLSGILASAAIIVDAREAGTLVDDRPRPTGPAARMLRKRGR